MSESKAFSFEKKAKELNRSESRASDSLFHLDLNDCSEEEREVFNRVFRPAINDLLYRIQGTFNDIMSQVKSIVDDNTQRLDRLKERINQGISLSETLIQILKDSDPSPPSKP